MLTILESKIRMSSMFKKIFIYLITILTLGCANYLSDSSDITISANLGRDVSRISLIELEVSASDFDTISISSTSNYIQASVPHGRDRTFKLTITLDDNLQYYGETTVDIDSSTSSVTIDLEFISLGSLDIEFLKSLTTEYDFGLGEDRRITYGESVTLLSNADTTNYPGAWYLNGIYITDNTTTTLTLDESKLLVGSYEVAFIHYSEMEFRKDSVVITVEPITTTPVPGVISSLEEAGNSFTLTWSQANDNSTVQSSLMYKVVMADTLGELTTPELADEPARLILSDWKYPSSYSNIGSELAMAFSDTYIGTKYVTIIVLDEYDEMSVYPPVSGVFDNSGGSK